MKRVPILFIAVLLTTNCVFARLDKDLVIYFSFDNVKGKIILDASGNKLHADIIANTAFVKGKYGNAIHIAAEPEDSDCVHIPADDLLKIEGGITMMAWVYHEDWNTAWGSWLDKGSQTQVGRQTSYSMGFFDDLFKGPNISMILGGHNQSWQFNTSGPMVNKRWHHITGIHDGKFTKIYLDGIIRSDPKREFEFFGINDADVRIGCAAGDPEYTFKNGSIDEVGLWRRALSEDEIRTAMQGPLFSVSQKDKVATMWGDIKSQR